MSILVAFPAFGRSYNNADEALSDFVGGADFVIGDLGHKFCGAYFSIRDESLLADEGYTMVQVHLSKNSEVFARCRIG